MKFPHDYTDAMSKIWHVLKFNQRLRRLDDTRYLQILYQSRMGSRLSLKNPRGFNEKLQWLKLNDRNPRYTTLVDKYLAKGVVKDILGDRSIVPTLGVWEDASEIDFENLPNEFVLKVNHNSGGVIICRDKSSFDSAGAVAQLNSHLKKSYFEPGREWPYRDVKPVVFAEEYLPSYRPSVPADDRSTAKESVRFCAEDTSSIIDYKFFCFHGEPRFLNVQQDMENKKTARFAFLNLDWSKAAFGRTEYPEYDALPPKPKGYNEMIEAARLLSFGIPFVRVDFFQHEDRVLFSEFTFFPTTGLIPFKPRSADRKIGEWLKLERLTSQGF